MGLRKQYGGEFLEVSFLLFLTCLFWTCLWEEVYKQNRKSACITNAPEEGLAHGMAGLSCPHLPGSHVSLSRAKHTSAQKPPWTLFPVMQVTHCWPLWPHLPYFPSLVSFPWMANLPLDGPSDFFYSSSGWFLPSCSSDTSIHTYLRVFALAVPPLKMLFPYSQGSFPSAYTIHLPSCVVHCST